MKSVGVRELRQAASEYLRQVEAGRTFEVIAHGRPVAGPRAPHRAPAPDAPLPSDVLGHARAAER
jgi:antitoxin (DNA-binding transcriptional repressor) of toxin-antitoxin stability system